MGLFSNRLSVDTPLEVGFLLQIVQDILLLEPLQDVLVKLVVRLLVFPYSEEAVRVVNLLDVSSELFELGPDRV